MTSQIPTTTSPIYINILKLSLIYIKLFSKVVYLQPDAVHVPDMKINYVEIGEILTFHSLDHQHNLLAWLFFGEFVIFCQLNLYYE